MAETASFIYDPVAMESLKTDLNKIRTEAQGSLKELQAQKTVAESTLAEAESTYNKELAVYEAAMVKYRAALTAYEEAMKSYESAMESFTEAMKNYKPPTPPNPCPREWTPPSPPSPPTPPTPPVEPTPPSPDAMNAAKAALAAVNESIAQVQSDIECLDTLVDTITNINKQVTESDKEAVHLLTNDFFKLWEFSGMQATGNDVANAIVNNAKAVKDGYDYIDTANGRLYLDLFDDEKLNMPQYIKLGETIGTTALVALMQQKGWGAEAIYHAAHTIDSSIDYNQVKGMYNDFANSNRQSPVHSDKSSTAQINNAMGSMDEDITVFVDGNATTNLYNYGGFTTEDGNISIKLQGATLNVTTGNTQYQVVSDEEYAANYDKYKGMPVITETQFDKMVSIMVHEQSNKSDEYLAIANVFTNNMETNLNNVQSANGTWHACNYDADSWFASACKPHDQNGQLYTSATKDSSGNYTGQSAEAAAALMDVLSGKRVFGSDVLYWRGDGVDNTFGTRSKGDGVWGTARI